MSISQAMPQQPINFTSKYPVGTLDELAKHRLPAKIFPACCEPGNNIRGCPFAAEDNIPGARCVFHHKGKTFAEGGGPRNKAVFQISPTTGVNETLVLPCYEYMVQYGDKRASGQVWEVVGEEGELVMIKQSIYLEEKVPGQPKPRVISDRQLVEVRVDPHPRPDENEQLRNYIMNAKMLGAIEQKAQRERFQNLAGMHVDPRVRIEPEDPEKLEPQPQPQVGEGKKAKDGK